MSDIPEARRELQDVLLYCDIDDDTRRRLKRVMALLGREKPITKAPVTSVKLTPKVKNEILRLKTANPAISYQEIATLTHTNIGRVSETLTGRRGARWHYSG